MQHDLARRLDVVTHDALFVNAPINGGSPPLRPARQGHAPRRLPERTRDDPQRQMVFTQIKARVQPEHVAAELPRGTTRPLVTVAPSRVKYLNPGGPAVFKHPPPALAILVEHKIHLAVLDEHRHRIMCEVRRDETALVLPGVAEARRAGVVRETLEHMLLDIGECVRLLRVVEKSQPQAEYRAVIAGGAPVRLAGSPPLVEPLPKYAREFTLYRRVLRPFRRLAECIAPADHVSQRREIMKIYADIGGPIVAHVTPIDETPARRGAQAARRHE